MDHIILLDSIMKYGWCAMELFDIVPSWCCRSKRRGWPQIRRVYEIREFGGTQWRRVASDRIIEIYWGELLCFELWGFLDSRNDDEWPDNPYYTFFINPPRTFISVISLHVSGRYSTTQTRIFLKNFEYFSCLNTLSATEELKWGISLSCM